MSIRDEDGNEIVSLPGFWQTLAKFALLASVPMVGLGMTWCIWVTTTIWTNKTDIAILKDARFRSNGGVSTNVNVGSAEAIAEEDENSARTWLTTQEVAAREKITDRTVINYIQNGMIQPEPVQIGKSWHIAENYRIVPKSSETCGTEGGSQ